MRALAQGLASTAGWLLLAMTALAALEWLMPLRARGPWNRAHLKPNLVLTSITFVTSAGLNAVMLLTLTRLQANGWGLLNSAGVGGTLSLALIVVALDFAFYVGHVVMHRVPALWRFHRVHHSDPALDVTTSIRQHPGEGLFRYLVMFVVASALGASPEGFALYRIASALNALPEHANLRFPRWLDATLSLVTTWPNLHKVHHSREPWQTDSNYGNLFSWWDRLFRTFTASHHGTRVATGLNGFDEPSQQTTRALLAMPFARAESRVLPVAPTPNSTTATG
jgi:sterol desaturase/sphingolipid hydroxylase (fatty acid hydroxylase superfamily)